MKWLKRIVITFLSLILLLVIALAATGTWVFKHPQEAWHVIETKFLPADLKITWKKIDFEGHWRGRTVFDFDWEIQDLLIEKENPTMRIPVHQFQLKSTLQPFQTGPKVILHELQVRAPEVMKFRPGPPSAQPEKNIFQQVQTILGYVKKFKNYINLEKLQIQAPEFDFESRGEAINQKPVQNPIRIRLTAEQPPKNGSASVLAFQVGVEVPANLSIQVQADGELDLQKFESDQPFLTTSIDIAGAGLKTKQKLQLQNGGNHVLLKTEGPLEYSLNKMHLKIEPAVELKLSASLAETNLQATIDGIPGPLVRVNHLIASMKTPLENDIFWSPKPSDFTVTAPISLFFIDSKMRPPLEKSCECKIPEVLAATGEGQIWLETVLQETQDKKPFLDANLSVESIANKLLSVDMSGHLKMEKKGHDLFYLPNLKFLAVVHSFQGIRKFLDAKNVLIPAPIDILDGTIQIKADGPVESVDQQTSLPFSVEAALASPRQRVNIKTENTVRLNSKFTQADVQVKAKIEDFQVELPPLDPLKGKPRVTSDSRILKIPKTYKVAKSPFKLTLTIEVETTHAGAIRLMSGYFHPYFPLTLQIHKSGTMTSGFIQAEPFEVEYLRRKVQVEKMKINLAGADEGILPVDGRFKIQQTQYAVYIDIAGTMAQPTIHLTSEPYLPEADIISVLLYDRTSDELISADAETSGSVQAAMADRAIGLFGLWAFAATPIKSFSYNPVTKIYTATIALSDDVTAGIGTNWEEATRLELRKRVSRQWMLTAAWTPATQDEQQSTKLVLQWEKRF